MSTKTVRRRLRAKAPTRIDLAGGTLDIWPLFLLIPRAQTINVGIDLFAEATLEVSSGEPGITLKSDDQNAELTLPWADLARAVVPAGLRIHHRLLVFYESRIPKGDRRAVTLKTRAKSPAGAGLGGSSALNIALTGVLSAWVGEKRTESLIDISRDIETGILGIPAGLQDYYGATYGGLQAMHWGIGGHCRNAFSDVRRKAMGQRLLLFYSGQSRNSGINNWALFKGYLDENREIQKKFELIALATAELGVAIESGDWKAVGIAIDKEWRVRKTLAAGISTPAIDRAMESAGRLGATAGKVCGAGGGGCFFVYVPDGSVKKKEMICKHLAEQGMVNLPAKTVAQGLVLART